jgi:hypothetical protein
VKRCDSDLQELGKFKKLAAQNFSSTIDRYGIEKSENITEKEMKNYRYKGKT